MTKDLNKVYEDVTGWVASQVEARRKPARVRLWDACWNLVEEINAYESLEFEFKNMDAGTATIVLPFEYNISQKLCDIKNWPSHYLYVTIDKDGARWSGMLTNFKTEVSRGDKQTVSLTFIHDYQKLKEILCWANPWLPAAVQFPKAYMLYGPTRWAVATVLLCNFMRLNTSVWVGDTRNKKWVLSAGSDPMSYNWVGDRQNDLANWPVVVKPVTYKEDTSLPCTLISRFKTVHETIQDACLDAQVSVLCRRYLEGDPDPMPGFRLRHGCLVIEVADKSGWNKQTSLGGTLQNGFAAVWQFITGNETGAPVHVDLRQVDQPVIPPEYEQPGYLGSKPEAPWVVLNDGPYTGIDSSGFEYTPPGAVQFVTGGSSMPYVNEGIKAGITALGGMLGSLLFGQTWIGSSAADILEPLYKDVFLAFMVAKYTDRVGRINGDGELYWDTPFELWANGSSQAYTISATSAIRSAMYDSRETYAATLKMADGAPYWVGDQGQGDFFLGDRVGFHAAGMPDGLLWVEQVASLKYTESASDRGWTITMGTYPLNSMGEFMRKQIEDFKTGLKEVGVW